MEMLPDSQAYRDALARCEKMRGITKEENKYERQKIRDSFDSCALDDLDSALATIAELQKRVEGLERQGAKLADLMQSWGPDTECMTYERADALSVEWNNAIADFRALAPNPSDAKKG